MTHLYGPFFTRKTSISEKKFLDDTFFTQLVYFRTYPTALLLKILGGRMHEPSLHLKICGGRPPLPPKSPPIRHFLISWQLDLNRTTQQRLWISWRPSFRFWVALC